MDFNNKILLITATRLTLIIILYLKCGRYITKNLYHIFKINLTANINRYI